MKSPKKTISYTRQSDGRTYYVEHPDLGLRLEGFADQIARANHSRSIDHTGWFCDEFQDSTYRGVVYRLPHGRLVAGFVSSNDVRGSTRRGASWEQCEGALIDLGEVYDDALEAARSADRMAEIWAEKERDYQAQWSAGNRFVELGRDLETAWNDLKALARDRYLARKERATGFPALCKAIEAQAARLWDTIEECRKERGELESTFGRSAGFAEGKL